MLRSVVQVHPSPPRPASHSANWFARVKPVLTVAATSASLSIPPMRRNRCSCSGRTDLQALRLSTGGPLLEWAPHPGVRRLGWI